MGKLYTETHVGWGDVNQRLEARSAGAQDAAPATNIVQALCLLPNLVPFFPAPENPTSAPCLREHHIDQSERRHVALRPNSRTVTPRKHSGVNSCTPSEHILTMICITVCRATAERGYSTTAGDMPHCGVPDPGHHPLAENDATQITINHKQALVRKVGWRLGEPGSRYSTVQDSSRRCGKPYPVVCKRKPGPQTRFKAFPC